MTYIRILSGKRIQVNGIWESQTQEVIFWEQRTTKRWMYRVEPVESWDNCDDLCGASGTVAEAIQVMCDLHPAENDIQGPRIFPVQHRLVDGLRQITSRTQFPGFKLDWNVNYFCPFALKVDSGTMRLSKCRANGHNDFHKQRMFATTFSHYVVEIDQSRFGGIIQYYSKAFAFPKNPNPARIPGVLPKPIASIVRLYLTENEMTIAEFRHACGRAIRDMEAVWYEGDVMLSIEAWGDTLVFRFTPASLALPL